MLEYLTPFIENSSPRLIPAWNQYVQAIETFKEPLYKRFMLATDHETRGITIMRYILSCVDWSYMKNHASDFDRYSFHVRFIKDDLENTFDHNTTGFRFFNTFTSKNLGRVQEFIIPVEDITSVTTLPFDKGWEHWIPVRPVRYLTHDSREFTLNVEKDVVKFTREQPNYAIIAIDVVALVFKYWKYMTEAPDDPEWMGKDQRRFLHKYVISGFLDDLTDIFLISHMSEISKCKEQAEILEFTTKKHSAELQYGYIGSRYQEASQVMFKELTKVKAGSVRPSAIFSSPLLGRRNSITQRINTIIENLDVPRLRQFEFYRYLRDKDLFNLMLNIFEFRHMDPLYERIRRHIKPKIQKLIRNKIWLYIKDPIIKSDIEYELEELNEKIQYR